MLVVSSGWRIISMVSTWTQRVTVNMLHWRSAQDETRSKCSRFKFDAVCNLLSSAGSVEIEVLFPSSKWAKWEYKAVPSVCISEAHKHLKLTIQRIILHCCGARGKVWHILSNETSRHWADCHRDGNGDGLTRTQYKLSNGLRNSLLHQN